MSDPLEKQFVAILDAAAIGYIRPDRDHDDPTTLDFYLPDLDLYIELKQYHSDRITRQLANLPENSNALVLIGRNSVHAFRAFIRQLTLNS